MGLKPPVEDSVGFMMLPMSAQALWFHLYIRSEEHNGYYRINKHYAHETREQIGATAADVRALMYNELIEEMDGYIYFAPEEIYPGPVVCENGTREVCHIFPGSRLETARERVSEYRRRSVFDFENT